MLFIQIMFYNRPTCDYRNVKFYTAKISWC